MRICTWMQEKQGPENSMQLDVTSTHYSLNTQWCYYEGIVFNFSEKML